LLNKTDRKTDVDEAINDYKDGRYKSCSLLLFSLIDRVLITSQPSKSIQKKQKLPTGKGAAKERLFAICSG
jgi:hypothetical protein